MAALIPGLEIQAEGAYDDQHQLIATVVKFKGNDLERAKSIQAGLHQTNVQTQKNQEELEKQNANLKAQAEALQQQHEKIVANQEKIAANKAAIAAASARFGQLDDYYILDEVSVLFANGKTNVDAQYQPQLLQLAEKAKGFEGYMIQVVGYASSTGSAALNQQLSEERAGNVTNILVQDGNIPLTNMLAPGAMGESRQIGDPNTEQGQAENRRVVVRVLQNKGIIGSQEIK
jgi:outer membrane protein OmpA-like peptidoglycan-associated protein